MAAPPPYNPSGYNPANPATWPQPIPPATLYQPGMAWTMTAAGTVDGQPVAVGDLLYVVHRPRLYGDGTYGSGMYGSTPDGDWTTADVRFVAWHSSYLPADQPPHPYAGCKFGETGWWVIIDAWFNDATDARRYGDGTYGSGVYGGGSTSVARWVDITAGFTQVTISRGTHNGSAKVDVTELDFTWYDPDWAHWDVTPPGAWFRPFVGAPIRVSFYDPQWVWHPRASGTIEQIVDPTITRHTDVPRLVTVQAFGNLMDLTPTLLAWQRPAETASTRFAALLAAAGWRFGTVGLVYPGDANLHADLAAHDVVARAELDRTAMSAGWTFDTDRRGRLRMRVWPLPQLEPPAIKVVDCADTDPAALVANLVAFTADESQLLNIVSATNTLATPNVVQATDPTSVALYGPRDNSLGFPATGLAFAAAADGQAIVERVRARYSRTVVHVEPLAADTLVDARWLPFLADVDTGEHVTVARSHPAPFTLESIVVGIVEQITPGRIEATLSTTTVTPTS